MEIRQCPIKYLDFHHTAGHEKDTEAVRREHMTNPNKLYNDIGYNIVIEPDGKAGIGRDPKYAGAHDVGFVSGEALNMNRLAFAICCIGNFETDTMTEVQYQGLLYEAVKAAKEYGVPVERFRKHSDQYSTACPGKNFPWDRLIKDARTILEGNTLQPPSDLEFVAPTGENIIKLPGIGWVETLADQKRVILHLGRSTYISMEDGGISLYARGKERRVLI